MADPNWAQGQNPVGGNPSQGGQAGQLNAPKAGINAQGTNQMMFNTGQPPRGYGPAPNQGYAANYNNMPPRPPGPSPGGIRPPGHFGGATFQPTSATPPPQSQESLNLPQSQLSRSNSSPNMPQNMQMAQPGIVNGLSNGPSGPQPSQLNGQMQRPLRPNQGPPGQNQGPQFRPGMNQPWPGGPPRFPGQGMSGPMISQRPMTSTGMSGPMRAPPPRGFVFPPGSTNFAPPQSVAPATSFGTSVAPPAGSTVPPPATSIQSGDRPTELPLPYQGQYNNQTAGITPGVTPSGSETPSQKSSRGPSPVPGQKYDALEGQFSGPGGRTPVLEQRQTPQPWQQQPQMGQASQGSTFMPQPVPQYSVPQPGPQRPPAPGTMGQPPLPPGALVQPPLPPGALGQPPLPPSSQTFSAPPASNVSALGVTGRRQYPNMPPASVAAPTSSIAPGAVPLPNQPVSSMAGSVQQPGYSAVQHPGYPAVQQPGYPAVQQPGYPTAQQPGYPTAQQPGYPTAQQPGYPTAQQPRYPAVQQPTYPSAQQPFPINNTYPGAPQPGLNTSQITAGFSNMSLQSDINRPINLLQEKNILPPDGVDAPRPNLPLEYKKANCSGDIFRCTLNAIPNTQSLLNKSRLPLGILIHPFKDLAQLPVIQSSVIVRCKSCRTYINPFVTFVDSRRWKCNLCYRSNDLPEEFCFDPVTKTYGEPHRRPEIKSGTIEFIAPSEYMLRPPQPAVYLFVVDVSFNARGTGYLQAFCNTLLDELDRLPGDSRTMIGFLAFDRSLYFFNLAEGLSQPQLLVVSDVEEVFLPSPDNLLVNLHESKELVIDLLNILPEMFKDNMETGSALGPALEASFKLMSPTGGRVSVFQTQLPTVGSGALKSREDPNERSGKKISHLGPATDFYKRLALDCSAQQVAVDLFMLNSQYADMASIACISKYSGGSLHYFPGYHSVTNPTETERFEGVLRRYITRKIGFEAVMRIRCSRGLSLHTFHGNFFVRSTDLLSLPNVNPEAAFGMQMSIEDTIEANYVCFQAALLYTSSKGERRIRVHTMAIPVTNALTEIHAAADQEAIVGLLAKMAVDKSLSASMHDARDALLNSAIDMLGSYGSSLQSSQRIGQLPCPHSLRLQPLFISAMLKSAAFRVGSSTKLDDRVYAMEQFKNLPLCYLMMMLYPHLYPIHHLEDKNRDSDEEQMEPYAPLLQLSSAYMDRHGVYLLDTGTHLIMWVGAAISDQFCHEVFDRPSFSSLPDAMLELPELENSTSELIRTFISTLNERSYPAPLLIIREDSKSRHLFLQHLVEDHTESSTSYYEFLQHLQKEVKS